MFHAGEAVVRGMLPLYLPPNCDLHLISTQIWNKNRYLDLTFQSRVMPSLVLCWLTRLKSIQLRCHCFSFHPSHWACFLPVVMQEANMVNWLRTLHFCERAISNLPKCVHYPPPPPSSGATSSMFCSGNHLFRKMKICPDEWFSEQRRPNKECSSWITD